MAYSKMKWSKALIKEVIRLYPTHTSTQIAQEIGNGCTDYHVNMLVGVIRKNGGVLPRKDNKTGITDLVKEVLNPSKMW